MLIFMSSDMILHFLNRREIFDQYVVPKKFSNSSYCSQRETYVNDLQMRAHSEKSHSLTFFMNIIECIYTDLSVVGQSHQCSQVPRKTTWIRLLSSIPFYSKLNVYVECILD